MFLNVLCFVNLNLEISEKDLATRHDWAGIEYDGESLFPMVRPFFYNDLDAA